jgi:ABC-type sugar transport system ATPase subunit
LALALTQELLAICDRILVMSRGEIVAEFARGVFDREHILAAAFREQGVAA